MSEEKKDKSPNAQIDKALKDMLKEVMGEKDILPEQMTTKVRVVQAAIAWEKVKHHIKDDAEFDPNF